MTERDFQNSDEWNDYLAEIKKQIRAEAIDEYSSKLWKAIERATVNCKFDFTIDDLHNLEIIIKGLAEEMKEQEPLQKQIPKKPDFEGDGYDPDGNMIYDIWICPCCGKHYEVDYDDFKHCPECGQAIDWGDLDG